MAIINPPVGGQARSIHVQQIINWLRGIPSNSEPVNFTGITSNSAHALTSANRGSDGLAFAAKNSDRTVTLFEAKNAGVIVRPNAADSVAFRVRNFADNGDIFSVTAAGAVSLGSETVATLTATQTLTNKTLTSPTLTGAIVSNHLDLANQASPPANPTAGILRLYEASDSLRYVTSAGAVRQLASLDGTETLASKTLTTPTLTTPIITTYADINQASAPSAPGAGVARLYSVTGTNLLAVRTNTATKELVDTDSTQTLSNKTISGATFSGTNLANPTITNYGMFSHSSNPGGTASKVTVWADTSNNLFVTTPGGSVGTVLTSINTPSVAGNSWARSLLAA